MRKPVPLILDCDPGHDDALAILLALAHPDIDLKLITTVAGNQTLEKTTLNALKVLALANREVEVAKGAKAPMFRLLEIADNIHGQSGLDGFTLPEPEQEVSTMSALEAQRYRIMTSPENVTLAVTGPMTNIGILLSVYPEVKKRIDKIVFMGGACFGGNWTPKAEFNIYVDPEAASSVINSGIDLVMCGLDVTHKAGPYKSEFDLFRKIDNQVGPAVAGWLDFFHRTTSRHFLNPEVEEPCHLHDVCTIAYIVKPDLFTTRRLNVAVETCGELTRGCTVVDYNRVTNREANTEVCFGVNREKFMSLLLDSLKVFGS